MLTTTEDNIKYMAEKIRQEFVANSSIETCYRQGYLRPLWGFIVPCNNGDSYVAFIEDGEGTDSGRWGLTLDEAREYLAKNVDPDIN